MNPWDPDRTLTVDGVTRAITAQFPNVDASELRFLGSGWEFDAWLSRDGWVFRFPRRAEAEGLFEPERRVHDLVRPALPSGVVIPCVELVGAPGMDFPYRFAAHRFIPGIPADEVDSVHFPAIARDLGDFLGALHAIPARAARAAGVREPESDEEGERAWYETAFDVLSASSGRDPVVDEAVRWARQVGEIPRYRGPLSLIHQDLSPEHVLVDASSGRLAGILDWTDVSLGDPARDFVFIVAWQGWKNAGEVLSHYPRPVGPEFRDRLDFMTKLLSVAWLGYAYLRGTEVAKLTGWVHNAFSDS
jgi:aminoglycoside phosphotransferase (APT) family kinase protein